MLLLTGAIYVMYFIFRKILVGFYFESGTPEFDLTIMGFGWFVLPVLFMCINMFASGLFTAFSNGAVSGLLSVLRTFVFLAIAMFGMSALLGDIGFWISWSVAEILACIVSVAALIRYRKRYDY